VGRKDLVALQTLKFESTDSAGFRDKDAGVFVNMPQWVPRAGPHRKIYFDPPTVTAAIVTCGGLCPGLNDVVQNIVVTLMSYGVPEEQILGIRFGLRGFYSSERKPVVMDRHFVDGIHLKGGTVLGTSRGGADIKQIVHRIKLWALDMVFVIGGNGARRGQTRATPTLQRRVGARSLVAFLFARTVWFVHCIFWKAGHHIPCRLRCHSNATYIAPVDPEAFRS
jgi:Phosphofructokinase